MDDYAALKEIIDERFRSRDEAVKVALADMRDRLAAMNEFRATLEDQATNFVRREEHNRLAEQIVEMQKTIANFQGRYATAAIVLSALLTIGTVLVGFFRHS